ncbi:hypothetical protein VCHC46B1_1423 [Vibrio cholerae HC-46B1]|nr:hypothetical protein VCHC43B1_1434 [Vibrio cholerae HC-43B1]EKL02923.1 hypothetical protein VCHC41B1_1928 [Vibrio cholerae HC-41B1]EKL97788.1 hypothetical protein VCHC46B1_1423 [Vibrio cholerae HC-46B1]EKM04143.1 hypothetical protein VCHC44C1_1569 [Vibrio cholerae HC-44C1]
MVVAYQAIEKMRHVTQFCADSQTPCFQYIRHTKKPSEEGLR